MMRIFLIFTLTLSLAIDLNAQIEKQKASYTGHKGYFTDLTEFNSDLICVFREGRSHFSNDGEIGIIRLKNENDGKWNKIASIKIPNYDLRDPKIIKISKHKLILLATGKKTRDAKKNQYQSFIWESNNGVNWKSYGKVAAQDLWLWSLHKNKRGIYSVSYAVGKIGETEEWKIRLHKLKQNKFEILGSILNFV